MNEEENRRSHNQEEVMNQEDKTGCMNDMPIPIEEQSDVACVSPVCPNKNEAVCNNEAVCKNESVCKKEATVSEYRWSVTTVATVDGPVELRYTKISRANILRFCRC